MAESYFYTVTSGTFSRSNADGSMTTFVRGETLESDDPELATRKKNLEPIVPGQLPSAAGFIPKRVAVEVASTTVAAAHAAEARESASKSQADDKAKSKARGTDPHAVTEKPQG
jgi:hypothetical protein